MRKGGAAIEGKAAPINFNIVLKFAYIAIAAACVVMYIVLLILQTLDISSFKSDWSNQVFMYGLGQQIYNYDTLEVDLFKYLNPKLKEPYFVTTNSEIVGVLYKIIKYTIIISIMVVLIYAVLMGYFEIYQGDSNKLEPLSKVLRENYTVFIIIGIAFIGSIGLIALYEYTFVKGVRKQIKSNSKLLEGFDNHLSTNITANANFVKAMVNSDFDSMVRFFNEEKSEAEKSKIIYTLNTFTYFYDNIPQNTDEFKYMKKLFENRNEPIFPRFDPTNPITLSRYITYKSKEVINDTLYTSSFVQGVTCVGTSKEKAIYIQYVDLSSQKLIDFLNGKINELDMEDSLWSLIWYQVKCVVVDLVFATVLCIIVYTNINTEENKEFVKAIWEKIKRTIRFYFDWIF